jgi:hypothetical protein
MVASAAVLAVMLGALAGAIAWAVKGNVFWAGVLAAGAYFAVAVLLESHRPVAAAIVGMPPLMLTLLSSWLAASYLQARLRRAVGSGGGARLRLAPGVHMGVSVQDRLVDRCFGGARGRCVPHRADMLGPNREAAPPEVSRFMILDVDTYRHMQHL